MNFNLRIAEGSRFLNEKPSYYYIGTNNNESIERVSSLTPVSIYGETFKELRKNIRAEFKSTENPVFEMTTAQKKRFSIVEHKVDELMEACESINRVYFHFNKEMGKPMIIVCIGVRTGDLAGIEQGRVIVSGVDTIIEENNFKHNNRCDYFFGMWNYQKSKNDKYFINIDCTRRKDEKPLVFRGKPTK
ncbi:MAG TPA: hypothetical protein DIS97_10580 [Citrobacter freundii]|nr:hypothetical protein [Citrobacter freundii]